MLAKTDYIGGMSCGILEHRIMAIRLRFEKVGGVYSWRRHPRHALRVALQDSSTKVRPVIDGLGVLADRA